MAPPLLVTMLLVALGSSTQAMIVTMRPEARINIPGDGHARDFARIGTRPTSGEAGGRGGERTPVVSHRLDLRDVAYAQRAYSTLAYGELLKGSLVDFTA